MTVTQARQEVERGDGILVSSGGIASRVSGGSARGHDHVCGGESRDLSLDVFNLRCLLEIKIETSVPIGYGSGV